jgi:Amt family ammonium transporter
MELDATRLAVAALACGALLVRVGFGWHAAGSVRAKNAAGVVLRSVADLAVAVLAFWAIGSAILNASGTVLGLELGRLFDINGKAGLAQFVQITLILIGTAPVIGAVAERGRFFPMLAMPALLAAIVIPIAGQWAWNGGWLQKQLGFYDAAGASVLHVTGGLAAAVAAVLIGPRTGKYNTDRSSNFIPGHSIPMLSVGAILVLAGWVPYLFAATSLTGGLTQQTAINVLLSGSAGTLTAIILSNARYGKPDVMLTYSGLLGGLVAITGCAGACNTISAVAIGTVAGVVVPTATVLIDLVYKIDDPAGGVAVHAVGGAWGTLAVGLFTPSAGVLDLLRQLGVQIVGLLVIATLAIGFSVMLLAFMRLSIRLRLTEDQEYDGTDLVEHDINAYPDFQQTMIKSYHLREA